ARYAQSTSPATLNNYITQKSSARPTLLRLHSDSLNSDISENTTPSTHSAPHSPNEATHDGANHQSFRIRSTFNVNQQQPHQARGYAQNPPLNGGSGSSALRTDPNHISYCSVCTII
ncbi:unnamed protein product, partial [Didymodactylos carnosus]